VVAHGPDVQEGVAVALLGHAVRVQELVRQERLWLWIYIINVGFDCGVGLGCKKESDRVCIIIHTHYPFLFTSPR
jgi:hypothetical protein